MKTRISFFLCAVCVAFGEPVVEGPLGKIRGTLQTVLDAKVEAFLGIPFAKPPTGELRFARPQAHGPVGDLEATKYGASCPQPIVFPLQEYTHTTDSEDCLFLNVFRRAGTKSSDRKAVVVEIHGGGFLWGSGGHVEYEMAPLAGIEDVITVSFNYRLGFLGFGFLEGSEFKNLGLFDQRLALEWVQENVKTFGGDPDRVTLIGVSAGSMSVNAQIVTPLNKYSDKKLFHAALMDAGVIAGFFISEPEIAETRTKCVAKAVGCTDDTDLIECLRKVDVNELLKSGSTAPCGDLLLRFGLTADGVFFPTDTEDYLQNHADDFLKVRTLIGHARNEGSMFAALNGVEFSASMSDRDFLEACTKISHSFGFRTNIEHDDQLQRDVVDMYLRKSEDSFTAVGNFIGDGIFVCPSNSFVKSYARVNDQLYVYRFERPFDGHYYSFDPKIFGVYHITPFIHFTGTYLAAQNDAHAILDSDRDYILQTMKVLSNFAKGDGPPVFRGVKWPDYSKTAKVLVFDDDPSIESRLFHTDQCDSVFSYFSEPDGNIKVEL